MVRKTFLLTLIIASIIIGGFGIFFDNYALAQEESQEQEQKQEQEQVEGEVQEQFQEQFQEQSQCQGQEIECPICPTPTGSIKICKIIIDFKGNLADGSAVTGTEFSISGIGTTTTFTSPLIFNQDIIGDDGVVDGECILYRGLEIKEYFYSKEKYDSELWEQPLYNDQYSVEVSALDDFFVFDELNHNADGRIVLTEKRPNRTLIILNQYKEQKEEIPGCADPDALNYNPKATIDDGSCIYETPGCMDSEALNYNSEATIDDGSCVYPQPNKFSISGIKFNDENNNGTYDKGEPGLSGWNIILESSILTSASAVSDAAGYYFFTGLEEGFYTICEEQKEGWIQTYPASSEGCYIIEVIDKNIENVNFGNYKEPLEPPTPQPPSSGGGGGGVASNFLLIDKTAEEKVVNPGGIAAYTVKIKNRGHATIKNLLLKDKLPEGFSYQEDSEFQGELFLGDLEYGETKTITYKAVISEETESGFYENTAELTSSNYKIVSDTAKIEVRAPTVLGKEALPKLELTKTANKSIVKPGSYVLYRVEVKNTGEAPAVNVLIKDQLPEGFIDNNGSSKIEWKIPLLEIGKNWSASFTVYIKTSVNSGVYKNKAIAFAENHPDKAEDNFLVYVTKELPHTAGGISVREYLIRFFWNNYPEEGNALIEKEPKIANNYLVISKIGVKIPIIQGKSDLALEKGAWLLPGSSVPNLMKNTVLAGHRYKYKPPHQETFYLLDRLSKGDVMKIFWEGEEYTYNVVSSVIVDPDNIEVLKYQGEPTLTLITCHPLYSDEYRLVVKGRLI